jgi:Holliday junction resolvase RusA-like endonuclease
MGIVSNQAANLVPTFVLAVSPSTNHLYTNARGKGRRKTKQYASWIRGELKALVAQRARPIEPPVSILITLPELTRGDASNRVKAAEDLLVRAGVIPNDSKSVVREVTVRYGKIDLMRVEVNPL